MQLGAARMIRRRRVFARCRKLYSRVQRGLHIEGMQNDDDNDELRRRYWSVPCTEECFKLECDDAFVEDEQIHYSMTHRQNMELLL